MLIGPTLESLPPVAGLTKLSSAVATLEVKTGDAAAMFSMNLAVLGREPWVKDRYGEDDIALLAKELRALASSDSTSEIQWSLRQLVFRAAG